MVSTGTAVVRSNRSPWISVFNVCNSAIGSGVLSFPYAFRQTGILGGLFITGVIWVIVTSVLCFMIRVSEKYNAKSYQGFTRNSVQGYWQSPSYFGTAFGTDEVVRALVEQMVQSTLGNGMAIVVSLVIFLLLFGGNVSYLLITGDVFTSFFSQQFEDYPILTNRSLVIIAFAVVVILPMALKTTIEALKYGSFISVAMLTYLAVTLVVMGVTKLISKGLPADILVFKVGTDSLIMIEVAVFAFLCHIQVVQIFAELAEDPNPFFGSGQGLIREPLLDNEANSETPSRRRSERVKRMDAVILVSMAICLLGYCLVGEFGYLLDQDVPSDVLNSTSLPKNVFITFARIGMAVVAMVCYPIYSHPARSVVDDGIKSVMRISDDTFSWTRHLGVTLAYFLATLAVALSVTDLSMVFQAVASTGGVTVIFIIPGILLVKGRHLARPGQNYEPIGSEAGAKFKKNVGIIVGAVLITLGILIFLTATYVNMSGLIPKG